MSGILLAAGLIGGALSVSAAPPASYGAGEGGGVCPAVTAIGSGGDGGYSYSWAVVSAPGFDSFTIDSPAAATTGFTVLTPAKGNYSATVRVTVTSGAETASCDVVVNFRDNTPIIPGP